MKTGNVKRIFSLVMVTIFCFTFLISGCGNTDSKNASSSTNASGSTSAEASTTANANTANTDKEPVTLDFTYFANAGPETEAWDDVIAKFEKDNPNIKINKQIVPSGDKYWESIDTRIAGKQYPDIARFWLNKMGKYASAGALLDITSMIDKSSVDDLFPAFKASVVFDDRLYGMPHHTDTMAIFYNKTLFDKAGLSVPNSIDKAWSWDEFLNASRNVKAKTGVKYAFSIRWTKNCPHRALPFLYMNGGSLVNSDMSKAAINNQQGIEFLQYIETWIKEGLIANSSPKSADNVEEMFANGVIAMVLTGNYMMSYFDTNMKDEWGVTYMPQVNGKSGSDLGGNAIAAFAGSKHPEEAAKFVEYVTNAENSKIFSEAANFLSVRRSTSEKGLNYESHNEEMKLFAEQVGTVDPDMAAIEVSSKFQPINMLLAASIENMMLNGASVEQTVKDLETGINEALSD